jgi:hypothetical protein
MVMSLDVWIRKLEGSLLAEGELWRLNHQKSDVTRVDIRSKVMDRQILELVTVPKCVAK